MDNNSKPRYEKQPRAGDNEDSLDEHQDGPPHKRRMTSKSPEPTSIFGDGKAAEESPLGAGGTSSSMDASGRAGALPVATPSGGVVADTAEDAEEPQIDRHVILFSERVVTILVGPSEVTWRLHENLLSSTSDFFRSAFNSGFRESIEDRLSLPEDDPQAFELFVRWMYARALAQPSIASLAPSPDGTASSSTASTTTTTAASASASASASRRSPAALPAVGGAAAPTIHTYLRLYVLACKLLVEELENACVDAAGAHWRAGARRPDVRDVAYVYRHTPPGAGMRRLLRERLALGLFRGRQHNPVTAEWRDVLNETPDLGFDLVREVSGYHWISGGNAPARAGSAECAFHRHERGEACRPG